MSEVNDDEARERHEAKTKAEYLAAVAELFRLLEMPADQKTPDHRKLLMAANDECGTKRTAMLAAWEGDKESWQR
jgi:hypothetical protein